MIKSNPTVEDWLQKIHTDLRGITHTLIAVAHETIPGAHEFVYHDAVGYSVNDSPFDRICYIAPQKKGYVNFGFFFGAGLPDPEKLLEGTGKRIRHVKIWSQEEANNPALAKLITETWKQAPERVAEVHAGMKKRKIE